MGFLFLEFNTESSINNYAENKLSFEPRLDYYPFLSEENDEWYKYNLDLFGEQIDIEYTGYQFFQPTEIRVSSDMLKKAGS